MVDSTYYGAITLHQKAEALECAIAILERWRELQVLTDPLRKEWRRVVQEAEKLGAGRE